DVLCDLHFREQDILKYFKHEIRGEAVLTPRGRWSLKPDAGTGLDSQTVAAVGSRGAVADENARINAPAAPPRRKRIGHGFGLPPMYGVYGSSTTELI
ncbi:hypothetical protein HPB47_018218, partial [Ixodes persulcatus]